MKKIQFDKYVRIVLISIAGSAVLTYLSCTSCSRDFDKFMVTCGLNFVMWVVMWIGNEKITCIIDEKISWVKYPVKRFIIGIVATVVFTIVVAIGIAMAYEFAWNVQFNSYRDFIIVSLIITFLISFFLHGREFLLRWRESAVRAERYQKENMMAQYESLKNQIDPHFLFNSLNVLTNLVYEDADKSAKFIKQLSEVYRYVLETRSKELVTLEEELKFVNAYLFLQQIRFGDKLVIQNNLVGQKGLVPPLVIQMLVENAIKHNTVSQEHPLTIRIYSADEHIIVENNLQKKLIIEHSTGIGLENIRKRYEFLTTGKVVVSDANNRFEVKLPTLQDDHLSFQ